MRIREYSRWYIYCQYETLFNIEVIIAYLYWYSIPLPCNCAKVCWWFDCKMDYYRSSMIYSHQTLYCCSICPSIFLRTFDNMIYPTIISWYMARRRVTAILKDTNSVVDLICWCFITIATYSRLSSIQHYRINQSNNTNIYHITYKPTIDRLSIIYINYIANQIVVYIKTTSIWQSFA